MGSQIKYLKANSVEDAVALLDMYSGKIKIFAGGTDLMVQMYHESKNWIQPNIFWIFMALRN